MTTLNIDEIQDILKDIITNNNKLYKAGKKTSAVEIMGESGIGKTSIIIQLAKDLGMDYVKLNLAQLEELGDLIGYPIKEYKMLKEVVVKDEETSDERTEMIEKWVSNDLLDVFVGQGFMPTGKSRMGYSLPEWVPANSNPNGVLLILDDYNRADLRFLTATMELK